MRKTSNIEASFLVPLTRVRRDQIMDLFEQIDQFEKMANELADKLEEGMAEDGEITEDLGMAERQAAAQDRFSKLAAIDDILARRVDHAMGLVDSVRELVAKPDQLAKPEMQRLASLVLDRLQQELEGIKQDVNESLPTTEI